LPELWAVADMTEIGYKLVNLAMSVEGRSFRSARVCSRLTPSAGRSGCARSAAQPGGEINPTFLTLLRNS